MGEHKPSRADETSIRRNDMGFMADLDGEKYDMGPDGDYAALAQEYFRYVEVTEELPWQTDRFEARPIDTKEKEALVQAEMRPRGSTTEVSTSPPAKLKQQ